MPTARPPRSGVTRAASATALLLALTGCSFFEGGSGPETSATSTAPSGDPSASTDPSADTVEETCARVLDTVRTAPERLREDPAGLFEEVDELAASAPDELTGQITAVRDAVREFRQGDRSLISVVQEVRGLQERCSG